MCKLPAPGIYTCKACTQQDKEELMLKGIVPGCPKTTGIQGLNNQTETLHTKKQPDDKALTSSW